MAWMNQEKKAKIAEQLKAILPRPWKWSLRVRHHSTLILTITAGPVDLLAGKIKWHNDEARDHSSVNPYWFREHFAGEALEVVTRIMAAMNLNNHDRSDIQTDYFDVGHYVEVRVGEYGKPYAVLPCYVSA